MNIKQYCKAPDELQKLDQWIHELKEGQEPFQFYTSGSTGTPKAISFSREQLGISVSQTQKAFNLDQTDLLLCPFSMNYVAGKMMVARAFFLEAELVFTGPVRNPLLIDGIHTSFIALVPMQLEAVLNDVESLRKLNQAKAIIIGGAPISQSLEDQVKELVKAPIFQTYGMTETLTHVAIRRLNQEGSSEWFQALDGVSFKKSAEACLEIMSPLSNHVITTNDVIELKGSSFKWLGRADWVINSAGFKIHPEKIEAAVDSIHAVGEALVCGVPDSKMGEIAVVVASYPCPEIGFKNALLQKLHKYEVPKLWCHIPNIPQLSNGKPDRQAARELCLNAIRYGKVQKIG